MKKFNFPVGHGGYIPANSTFCMNVLFRGEVIRHHVMTLESMYSAVLEWRERGGVVLSADVVKPCNL